MVLIDGLVIGQSKCFRMRPMIGPFGVLLGETLSYPKERFSIDFCRWKQSIKYCLLFLFKLFFLLLLFLSILSIFTLISFRNVFFSKIYMEPEVEVRVNCFFFMEVNQLFSLVLSRGTFKKSNGWRPSLIDKYS